MKILEHINGKIIAEIPGPHYTRIVCNDDSFFLNEFKSAPLSSIGRTFTRNYWPKRMDTQKYSREIQQRKVVTTENLRKELELRHV